MQASPVAIALRCGQRGSGARRTRADDPAPGRKALVSLAQRKPSGANRGSQTEDQRVQDPDAKPYTEFSSNVLRGADDDSAEATRACRSRVATALSARRRGVEQLSRTRRRHGTARTFPMKAYQSAAAALGGCCFIISSIPFFISFAVGSALCVPTIHE